MVYLECRAESYVSSVFPIRADQSDQLRNSLVNMYYEEDHGNQNFPVFL